MPKLVYTFEFIGFAYSLRGKQTLLGGLSRSGPLLPTFCDQQLRLDGIHYR